MGKKEKHWRTITQAAVELGRSERTIRRWLESGRVKADRTKTPLRVNIADELDATQGQTTTPGQTRDIDLDKLQADLATLQTENDRLAAVLAGMQVERDHLGELLEQVGGERDHLRQALDTSQTLIDQQQRLTTTLTGQKLISAPGERRTFWQWLGLAKVNGEDG